MPKDKKNKDLMSTQVGNFPQNDRILLQHCSITCIDACFSRTSPTSSYIMICSSSVHDCKVHSSESISFTFRCCWQHLVLMSSTSTSIRFVFPTSFTVHHLLHLPKTAVFEAGHAMFDAMTHASDLKARVLFLVQPLEMEYVM